MHHRFTLIIEKIANKIEDYFYRTVIIFINTIKKFWSYIKENINLNCLVGKHKPNKDWVRDFKTSRMKCICLKCDTTIIASK